MVHAIISECIIQTENKNIPRNILFCRTNRQIPTNQDNTTSNDVLGQRQNLEVLLLSQLMGHGTEDAGADQLALVVHEDYRVVVELDLAAIAASFLHGSTDDHSIDDVSFLDLATRLGLLDRPNDRVPKPCSFFPPQGLYAHNPLGPGVIHDLEVGPHLDECSDLLKMG